MEGLTGRLEEEGGKRWTSPEKAGSEEGRQVEQNHACESDNCKGKDSFQEMRDEAVQPNHLPPPPPSPAQPPQATCPLRPISATHPDSSREHWEAVLDSVLKNQEALLTVLRKQDILKGLVDRLQKTVSTIEERVQAIEREMGTFTQFTQELSQVGNEINWG